MTEYHYHDSPQYGIEVVYFTKDQLQKQLEELLLAYRQFHSRSADDDDECDLKEASSVAWHTFEAAFRNQSLLTEEYLREKDEQTLFDNISAWINQSAPQGYYQARGVANVRKESADDEKACSDLLTQLTCDSLEANVAASWPYIERVRYEFKRGATQTIADFKKRILTSECFE